jgi:quinol monooxygenase YgiN
MKYVVVFFKSMSKLQVSAKMKIHEGMGKALRRHAVESVLQAKKKDIGTLQFDWFISSDGAECEIREIFESSEAALAHRSNLRELSLTLFGKLVSPNLVTIYGDPSPELLEKVKEGGVDVKVFSFLAGL